MTDPQQRDSQKRDRRRPFELIGLSAVIGIGLGLVVLMATREPVLALTWAGIAFIVVLVVVAMLALTTNPHAGRRDDGPDPDRRPDGH